MAWLVSLWEKVSHSGSMSMVKLINSGVVH